ncbi:MAG: hypothetical protein ABEJ80_01875, partial [Halarchaeum sp.]
MTDSEQWERVGRKVLWMYAFDQMDDFEDAFHRIANKVSTGEDPTLEDLQELRRAHENVQRVIEEEFTAVIDGAESWEGAASTIPYGELARAIGVPLEKINE